MIHAIETTYNGRRFRSRLEARWAVFFDALRTHYVYEPEGYDLKGSGWVRTDGPGLLYLPDFWLTDLRIYIEVKPSDGMMPFRRRGHTRPSASFPLPLIAVFGEPGSCQIIEYGDLGCCDLGVLGQCPACGSLRYGYRSDGDFTGTPCRCEGRSDLFDTDTPAYMAAVQAALSARFEHGEQPEVKHRRFS